MNKIYAFKYVKSQLSGLMIICGYVTIQYDRKMNQCI